MEKNKKIAILSMQRVVNFGSVLQAHSLRQIIREVTGASVEFLDIRGDKAIACQRTTEESVDYIAPAAYPPGVLQKAKRWTIARLSARNKKKIRRFMAKELNLRDGSDSYDCVVVGSDEVFNHARGVNLQLHGDVEEGKKVISYAAACGCARVEDIPPEQIGRVRQAMAGFSAVSVRDSGTRQYAAALYDGEILHHLDPVLVGDLDRRSHKPVFLKNYLLVYGYGQRIRTREEIDAIRAFARKKGLKTASLGGSQFWCDLYIPADPFRMLDYFYYADFVVTDTFHGAIFSVIHKKQFAVIPRKTNQTKICGLLEDLQLSDRKLDSIDQLEQILTAPVDYSGVEQILKREKLRTRTYLKEQLGA